LWAVRLCKSRSIAIAACRGGRVRINGRVAKPSSTVRVGDRVSARLVDRDRVVEVVQLIDERVSAPLAAECLQDHSPPAQKADYVPPLFRRDRGTGRPTKRERRQLDRFRDR
jgi:ribosome-associated heat shock protein Hsp15